MTFGISRNPGFRITFENGNTVSVQWGPDNYCDNSYQGIPDPRPHDGGGPSGSCENAEIAAGNKDNVWYKFRHDEVKGWCKPDDVANFIGFVATCTSDFKPTDVSDYLYKYPRGTNNDK